MQHSTVLYTLRLHNFSPIQLLLGFFFSGRSLVPEGRCAYSQLAVSDQAQLTVLVEAKPLFEITMCISVPDQYSFRISVGSITFSEKEKAAQSNLPLQTNNGHSLNEQRSFWFGLSIFVSLLVVSFSWKKPLCFTFWHYQLLQLHTVSHVSISGIVTDTQYYRSGNPHTLYIVFGFYTYLPQPIELCNRSSMHHQWRTFSLTMTQHISYVQCTSDFFAES